jgi:hypothetical protein
LSAARFAAALCLCAALPAWSGAADAPAQRPLASVTVIAASPSLAGMPPDAPRPVWYNLPDSMGAGCGLVMPLTPELIVPVLEPEPHGNWPSCLGFIDGTAFVRHGKAAYVFRYRQGDTREDTTIVSLFVPGAPADEALFATLNGRDPPPGQSIRRLAAWGKSTLAALEAADPGYDASARDSIQTDQAYLQVSRNARTAHCRLAVDLVAEDAGVAPLDIPCSAILAATTVSAGGTDYFAVMLQDATGGPRGIVFKAGNHAVGEAKDLEASLAPQFGAGKMLAVKAALRRLVAPP